MQLAVARAQVALDAPVLQSMPVAARHALDDRLIHVQAGVNSGAMLYKDSLLYACCTRRRACGALPLPSGERVGVRGFDAHRETLTPHPTPLPTGEGADRVRGPAPLPKSPPALHLNICRLDD